MAEDRKDIQEEVQRLLQKREQDFTFKSDIEFSDMDEAADKIFDALYEHVHTIDVDYE